VNLTVHDTSAALDALGPRLKFERRRCGLTQFELSTRVGIHRAQLAMLESGRRHPNLETLTALALALDVSTDALLGMADLRRAATAAADAGLLGAVGP
jgi:transcriptional regulator with XRE-family HTH domain